MVAGSNGALSSAVTASLIRSSNRIGGSIESYDRINSKSHPDIWEEWGPTYGKKGSIESYDRINIKSHPGIWEEWGATYGKKGWVELGQNKYQIPSRHIGKERGATYGEKRVGGQETVFNWRGCFECNFLTSGQSGGAACRERQRTLVFCLPARGGRPPTTGGRGARAACAGGTVVGAAIGRRGAPAA